MTPTLLSGDVLLVRSSAPPVTGAVVLARFRSGPDLIVVKRAVSTRDGGWTLASDNPGAGADSRQYGVADVIGVAWFIWARGPGRVAGASMAQRKRRWIPSRLSNEPPIG